jgi:hypothetical protein
MAGFTVAAVIGGDSKEDVLREFGIDEDDPGAKAILKALKNWGKPSTLGHLMEAAEQIAKANTCNVPWHLE